MADFLIELFASRLLTLKHLFLAGVRLRVCWQAPDTAL